MADIHFRQYEFNPLRLPSSRLVGWRPSWQAGRASVWRGSPAGGTCPPLDPDHLLITGDPTTTALSGSRARDRRRPAG
jgi:hypothetical protein